MDAGADGPDEHDMPSEGEDPDDDDIVNEAYEEMQEAAAEAAAEVAMLMGAYDDEDDDDWEAGEEHADDFLDEDDFDEDEDEDDDEDNFSEEEDEEMFGNELYAGQLPSEALAAADGAFARSVEPNAYPIQTLKYHHQVADAIACQSLTTPGNPLPDNEMVVLYRSRNDSHKRIMLLRVGGDEIRADAEKLAARRRREPGTSAASSSAGAPSSSGGDAEADDPPPPPGAPQFGPHLGVLEVAQAQGQGYEPLADGLLPLYPYSLSRSSCGKYIAVCGSYGLFTIFQAKPLQRAAVQNGLPRMPQLLTGIITCKEEDPGNPHWLMQDNMNNSVRFGNLFGRERIIIACQVGQLGFMDGSRDNKKKTFAYVMNIPEPGSQNGTLADQLSCIPPTTDGGEMPAGATCQSARGDTVVRLDVKQVAVVRAMDVEMLRNNMGIKTAVLGPFPMDLNCVVPSPDGKWVAAVADSLEMYLVRFGEGDRAWEVVECITVPMSVEGDTDHINMQTGSQYVAWNRDSTMVAATTDITGRLFVYSIESRRLVGGGHTKSHGRPCMALSWSPFNSNLLAYAQDAFHVHITDVTRSTAAQPWQGCQILPIPKPKPHLRLDNTPQSRMQQAEVHGISWGGSELFPALFVATAERLLMWRLKPTMWSPASHSLYPQSFKRATLAVLQGSLLDAKTGSPRCLESADPHPEHGLWSLPKEILLSILAMSAEVPEEWLASCLQPLPAL